MYERQKKYYTRVASVNGWTNNSDKLQHLLLALDGLAAEVVAEIDDQSLTAYDDVWQALARRFGSVDESVKICGDLTSENRALMSQWQSMNKHFVPCTLRLGLM